MTHPDNTATVSGYLDDLGKLLTARGLLVTSSVRASFLMARNADLAGVDPIGRRMNPGLTQVVVLGPNRDGELSWWWQWSGPDRNAPPELEYMLPADAVNQAAARICHVLGLTPAHP